MLNSSIRHNERGTSLLEVLVSLVIIAVGVLGISKMQALALSNTQVSSSRGLIALQAASLAANMHDNKSFWQVATTATPPCNVAGQCVLAGNGLAAAEAASSGATTIFGAVPPTCTVAVPCTSKQIAALEMNTLLANLFLTAPTYSLNITCDNTNGPTNCVIDVSWAEKQTGGNAATASVAAAQATVTQNFFLYVQP